MKTNIKSCWVSYNYEKEKAIKREMERDRRRERK
jgi:hypothetical protein